MSLTGKGDDACVKEKRHRLDKGDQLFFLFQAVTSVLITSLLTCLGTTHTSLDVASVSPFHPVAALSRSALCWNIQDPQLNYKLTLTWLWQTSKRKLTLMEAWNTKCGHIHTWKRLTHFWHLKWGIQPFSMYTGKTPSSMEWPFNPVNKGKYKRNVFVSYLLLSFLLYYSFWDFLGRGITPTNQRWGKIK